MKRLLTLMLLAGAFLGGYYVRGLPGSPDIFDSDCLKWLEKGYRQARQLGEGFVSTAQQAPTRLAQQPARPTGTIIEIGGRLYRIGGELGDGGRVR